MSLSPEVLGIIRRIREDIAAIGRRLQEYIDARGAAEKAEAEQRKISKEAKVPVEVSYASAARTDNTTDNKRNRRPQWVTAAGTWAAVIAASIYAGISACQLAAMRQQTRQNLESFRIDERAWVEIQPPKPTLKSHASDGFGALFTYSIFPKNVGKTAAYEVKGTATRGAPVSGLSLGDNPDEIRSYQNMLVKNVVGMPNVLIFRRVPNTLGPGEISSASFDIYGQEPQKGLYQFLIGRIDYVDAFKVPHWVTFCFFIADSEGNLQYCQYGNDQDRNPELPSS